MLYQLYVCHFEPSSTAAVGIAGAWTNKTMSAPDFTFLHKLRVIPVSAECQMPALKKRIPVGS